MGKQSSRLYFQGKDHKDIYYQGHYHDAMYIGSTLVWEKIKTDEESYKYILRLPVRYTFHEGKFYIVFLKYGKNVKGVTSDCAFLGCYICDSYDMHKINAEYKINMDEPDIDKFFRGDKNSYTVIEGSDSLNFIRYCNDDNHVYGYYFENYDISKPIKKGLKMDTVVADQNKGMRYGSYSSSHAFTGQHVLCKNSGKIDIEDGLGTIIKTVAFNDLADIYFDGYKPVSSVGLLAAFKDKICVLGCVGPFLITDYSSVVAFIFDKSGNFVWYRKSPRIYDNELENEILESSKMHTEIWKYADFFEHDYTPEILEVDCYMSRTESMDWGGGTKYFSYFCEKDAINIYSNRYVVKMRYMSDPYKDPPVWTTICTVFNSADQGYKMTITEDEVLYDKCSFSELTSKYELYDKLVKAVYIPDIDDYAYISCVDYVVTVTIEGNEYVYSLGKTIEYSPSIFHDEKRIYILYEFYTNGGTIDADTYNDVNGILIFDIENKTFEETNIALYKEG